MAPRQPLKEVAQDDEFGRLRRERDRWRAEAERRGKAVDELENQLATVTRVAALSSKPPKWTVAKKHWGSSDAVVVAVLSDLHLDEVVRREDLGGINEYNRSIAERRLEIWAQKLAGLPSFGPSADIKGLVVLMAGDTVNGDIHEGRQTNEDTLLGTMLHWSGPLAAALDMQLDSYPEVHVCAVVGNHGRMSPKPRYKLKARDNADWHLAHLVSRTTDKRMTWAIPESPDCLFEVMGQRHGVTHGDGTNGGQGIGGIWPPIKRMIARKQNRYSALGQPVSMWWMGHWHQTVWADDFVINGSLKGYDEYAQGNNFLPAPAEQSVAYVTDNGIQWRTTLICE